MQTKTILYRNLWNFALLFAKKKLGSYCVEKFWKKIMQVISYVDCTPIRTHVRKQITKNKIRGWKFKTFCFRKTNFVHSRSGTYYVLLLGYLDLKFIPDICHYVYWVLAEIWAPNSSHKICNKFFIHHCQSLKECSFLCETVWFFPRWILIRLTWNLSRFVPNSVEILTLNFRKKLFRENFSEILCKLRLSSTETCEISLYFLQFFLGPYCVEIFWNKSCKYFHMLFAPR